MWSWSYKKNLPEQNVRKSVKEETNVIYEISNKYKGIRIRSNSYYRYDNSYTLILNTETGEVKLGYFLSKHIKEVKPDINGSTKVVRTGVLMVTIK